MAVRSLEDLMADAAIEPREVVFRAPWEARAFAIALSLCESGKYKWPEFQRMMIAEISADTSSRDSHQYYRQFVGALEKLLSHKRLIDAREVESKIQQLKSS